MSENVATRPESKADYPLFSMMAVVPHDSIAAAQHALVVAGIPAERINVARDASDSAVVGDDEEPGGGLFDQFLRVFEMGDEHDQRDRYTMALRNGDAVIRVQLEEDETIKQQIARTLHENNGRFINFYGRWTSETIVL